MNKLRLTIKITTLIVFVLIGCKKTGFESYESRREKIENHRGAYDMASIDDYDPIQFHWSVQKRIQFTKTGVFLVDGKRPKSVRELENAFKEMVKELRPETWCQR